jgi:hypothetical protein
MPMAHLGREPLSASTTIFQAREDRGLRAAHLPMIDSQGLPFEVVCDLAMRGPRVAVGELASPPPWGAFSYAPLAAVADAYRAAGAEMWNLPPVVMAARKE